MGIDLLTSSCSVERSDLNALDALSWASLVQAISSNRGFFVMKTIPLEDEHYILLKPTKALRI
jgi:hypothetical protein